MTQIASVRFHRAYMHLVHSDFLLGSRPHRKSIQTGFPALKFFVLCAASETRTLIATAL